MARGIRRPLPAGALVAAAALLLGACGGPESSGTGSATGAGSGAGSGNTARQSDSGSGSWKPEKPIEVVAPAATGGGWDSLARSSSRVLQEQKFVDSPMRVVNKPGAGGAIGWAYVAKYAGDPHKLFVTSPPILLVPEVGQSDQTYRDFTPIARLNSEPLAYVVKKDSPIKDFGDLVQRLKKSPKHLSVGGGSGPGSLDHVGFAGAVDAAGVDPTTVNYVTFDGGGEALTSLLGGHVKVAVAGASEAQGLADSGDVRVLATSSAKRAPNLRQAPTLQEEGVDYVFDIWRGVMGPKNLSDAQVAYYEKAFHKLTESPAWRAESKRMGWTDAYMGSAEFERYLGTKSKEYGSLLSDIGLRK